MVGQPEWARTEHPSLGSLASRGLLASSREVCDPGEGGGLGRGRGAAQPVAVPGLGVTGAAPRASRLDHCQGTGGLVGAWGSPVHLAPLGPQCPGERRTGLDGPNCVLSWTG